MLPIYYRTSSLTSCQISGLMETFENIIQHQTALKLSFRSRHLIGQKILAILRILIFSAAEICAEQCCQSTWEHLPQLSAKFEHWMKHLSVLDMKQQYILKLILIRGITLFSTAFISRIPSFIDDLLLDVALLSSCFGTQKWWQNDSQNLIGIQCNEFWFP